MAAGRAPFVVLNRGINPVVRAVLRSPLHPLFSGRLMLLTVTGRKTGREHTFPVQYRLDGDRVLVTPSAPDRKLWWRNLRGGADVTVWLRGRQRTGHAEVHGDAASGVRVEIRLA